MNIDSFKVTRVSVIPVLAKVSITYSPVKVTTQHIVPGAVLYHVYALGESSFIERVIVKSRPYEKSLDLGLFIDTVNLGLFIDTVTGSRSLIDMNIIPNGYNSHRAFLSKEDAEAYLDYCLFNNINF